MNPLQCPACGNRAMSYGAKLVLGPLRNKVCKSCGVPLTLPLWELWIEILIVLVPIPVWLTQSWIHALATFAGALALGSLVQLRLLPLVRNAT
jgi:hypothetical protein